MDQAPTPGRLLRRPQRFFRLPKCVIQPRAQISFAARQRERIAGTGERAGGCYDNNGVPDPFARCVVREQGLHGDNYIYLILGF